MVSKPPLKTTSPPPTNRPVARTASISKPSPSSSTSEPAHRASEAFRKRRTGLWAAGVAVIVGAGALLGAQLKTTQQAKERYSGVKRPSQEKPSAIDSAALRSGQNASKEPNVQIDGTKTQGVPRREFALSNEVPGNDSNIARGSSYIQQQISFLEDRRGALLKEKFDLEQKIGRVKEKMKREAELEGARSTSAGVGR